VLQELKQFEWLIYLAFEYVTYLLSQDCVSLALPGTVCWLSKWIQISPRQVDIFSQNMQDFW